MHEERLVGAERCTNARKIVLRHAATALKHRHCRITGQANGEGDNESDGDNDEDRL
ncbi:hypothetical protein D3C87_2139150 [compost metagenome]